MPPLLQAINGSYSFGLCSKCAVVWDVAAVMLEIDAESGGPAGCFYCPNEPWWQPGWHLYNWKGSGWAVEIKRVTVCGPCVTKRLGEARVAAQAALQLQLQ